MGTKRKDEKTNKHLDLERNEEVREDWPNCLTVGRFRFISVMFLFLLFKQIEFEAFGKSAGNWVAIFLAPKFEILRLFPPEFKDWVIELASSAHLSPFIEVSFNFLPAHNRVRF